MDRLNFYETKIHLMRLSIWYHLNNLKNVKNTHGRLLFLVNLQAWVFFMFLTLFHWCFLCLLNCPNGTKSRNASHLVKMEWYSNTEHTISSSTHFVRGCHPKVFCEEDFLKNFEKFKGKHLCQSLFFNKVVGLY